MPIIDSEKYHETNTSYVLDKISQQVVDDGMNPDEIFIFFFNIYTGGKFIKYPSDFDTFDVARNLDFATVWLVFHQVTRGEVVRCESEFVSEIYDDCITVLWAATEPPNTDQISQCLDFVDDIIRKIEIFNGIPCPIPLTPNQITRTFELGIYSPSQKAFGAMQVLDDTDFLPEVAGMAGPPLLYLQGYLNEKMPIFETKVYQITNLATEWQRRTIRALGTQEWANAIVSANTWIEIFCVRMAVVIKNQINEPIEDIRTALNRGLHRFITHYIGGVVRKGFWDVSRDGTEMKSWYDDCYEMRHRVVHMGYLPAEQEAFAAYEAAHRFIRYVTRQLSELQDERLNDALVVIRAMVNSSKDD